TLSQAGNPLKPLLAKQANANKFSTASLMRDNIQNQPTQAETMAQQANPNAPVAQQSDLEAQLRQQRLDTAKQVQEQRDKQQQDLLDLQEKNKQAAIGNAATFLVSAFLGQNNNTSDVKSGVGAGRSAGAQMGMQSQTVLNNMRQQFNPNAFKSGFGG
ncbi:hypothetical protein, partial [Herbiconiux daphne]